MKYFFSSLRADPIMETGRFQRVKPKQFKQSSSSMVLLIVKEKETAYDRIDGRKKAHHRGEQVLGVLQVPL
jgi:hypothetical protein